jgi:spore coat polysaccharide biosynthesis protein SpsF
VKLVNAVDAIIQARLGSSRFPNKVLLDIQGRPLLGYCIDRLKQIPTIDKIIIATTSETIDDPINEFCINEKILCYRGSEKNVLNRFLEASIEFKSDRFLRICSDNPFIDKELIEYQISEFDPDDDYCSYYTQAGENAMVKPVGFFVEAVTRKALEKAAELGSDDPRTQEHVTYYIYNHPIDFKIKKLLLPDFIDPELRFTIDYPEDVFVAEYILNKINKPNATNIMNLVHNDSELKEMINKIAISYPKIY